MASNLAVRLVSPEAEVFRGEASSVVAPAWDGMVGILPGHAAFITLLGHGEMAIDLPGGGSEKYFVAGGGLKVDSSMHIRFDYDETAFRFVMRYDGQPSWKSALTPKRGSNTLSPFVVLNSTRT